MINWRTVVVSGVVSLLLGSGAAWATVQTNYLGTVFLADTGTPSHQMTVNADGSINVVCH